MPVCEKPPATPGDIYLWFLSAFFAVIIIRSFLRNVVGNLSMALIYIFYLSHCRSGLPVLKHLPNVFFFDKFCI